MKCKNCNCQVSSDFKHSFTTNVCPKCGQTLMTNDVKELFLKMSEVLVKNNNDIGDLAIWFVDTYLTVEKDNTKSESESESLTVSEESQESTEETVPALLPKVKKPAVKVTRTQLQDPNKEQSLLSADRTKLFSKRAGVDKIKYETIVKDIQGGLAPQDSMDMEDTGDIGDGDGGEYNDFNEVPLSNREMQSVASLFESQDSGTMSYGEIEKIQKLEQLAITGSVGKIRRSS
jgi:hypothetical protein